MSAKDAPHTQLIQLTGRNKRVLEVGPATGYVTGVLRSRGCRVTAIEKDPAAAEVASRFCDRIIVGDAEEIDLSQTFGEQQFDVVIFGDVLEHLMDPRALLEKVRPLLRERGYVVASIPNVSHASVRLMLLDGRFAYAEKGLMDHTHLRFFTKAGVETLFEEAGYDIRVWHRVLTPSVEDPSAEETSPQESELPPHLLEAIREDPEALTYQFVLRAYPRRTRSSRKRKSQATSKAREGTGSVLKSLWDVEDVLAKNSQDIAHMETTLAEKEAALVQKDALLAEKDAQLRDLQTQFQLATSTVGYRLLEQVRRPIRWLAPEGTRRRLAFIALSRALNIILTRGPIAFFGRLVRVWEWLPDLRRGAIAAARPNLNDQYQIWLARHAITPTRGGQIEHEAARLTYRPRVSIIMPVYNPNPDWLRDAVESVRTQLYDNWELCIADDGSSRADVRELLEEYSRADQHIKVTYLDKNRGIAAASNAALSLATGEYVGLLDHDDELKPEALFEVVSLLNERPHLDFIYSDEDKKAPDGRLVEPFFKPDWSPDFLMSVNYVAHFSVFRKDLVDQMGGFRMGYDGSQDYDLVLRVTEATDQVAHIARPLYTWRKTPGSAASSVEAKTFAYRAGKRVLEDALTRRGLEGEVLDGLRKGQYRVRYKIVGSPKVAVIIPTRDRVDILRRCVDSINKHSSHENYEIIVVDNDSQEQETLDYLSSLEGKVIRYPSEFNFAKIMNLAAREADCDALIFLNNDTEVISHEWMEAMLEHGQRPEVAAVGARLLYPDGRVQHEGIVMGLGGGSAGNVDHGGYFGLGDCIRNCTAVTAACMLTRPSVFWELGGFDERLRVAFNDVDFCLRARQEGYLIVYTPFATLYHHESATRGRLHPDQDERLFRNHWGNPGKCRDPYYNPNLDLRRPFTVRL